MSRNLIKITPFRMWSFLEHPKNECLSQTAPFKVLLHIVFLIFLLGFSFSLAEVQAEVYSGDLAVCGNGVCEGGQGELSSCPQDCDIQTCSPGKDCLADPCTIPTDPLGYCVYPPGQPTGTCQFQLDAACTICLNNGNSKWYGAWGDYACRLQGFTTGSSCVTNLAPLSVADFTINSCDGTENCCTSGQSSCIGKDQCGSWNEAAQQITDKNGIAYAGGTQGFCREKCTAGEVNNCRFVSGVGERCVSCSYRPDKLWQQDFPTAQVWSATYVSQGVWVEDSSCVLSPACSSPNGGCLSNVANAATKPGTCAASLTCGDCAAGYYFDALKQTCEATCTALRNAAAGGCTSTFTVTDSTDLGKADCNLAVTDKCVTCKTGYVWDGTKCVLGCKQEENACTGTVSASNCCPLAADQVSKLYCSKGLDGTGFVVNGVSNQGYCCAEGQYWDDAIGACQPTFLCVDTDCPTLPSLLTAPSSYLTQDKLYFLGRAKKVNNCVLDTKSYRQACVLNTNLGPTVFRVYGPIHVLDDSGTRVS